MEERRRRQNEYKEYLDAQVREKEANQVSGGVGGGNAGRRLRRLAKPSSLAAREAPLPSLPPLLGGGAGGGDGGGDGGGSSSSSNNSRDNLAVRNPAYPSPRAPAPRHVSKMGGSELGQQLVVEIQQREALASQLTQLAEEVERTRAEGARQSAAALRLHQREAEATGSLRERLRIVETELVEARAFRANVERRMGGNVDGSGAAGFVGGGLGDGATAAVVAQLRLELDQEKERRVTDAAKVREAEAAAREVSARLAAQGEEFAAEMRRAGERVGALEEALTRERERANDVSRLEAETAGRLEGLRSLVDQRVEVSRNGTERNGLSVSLSTNR